jgi:hypothetical protein
MISRRTYLRKYNVIIFILPCNARLKAILEAQGSTFYCILRLRLDFVIFTSGNIGLLIGTKYSLGKGIM